MTQVSGRLSPGEVFEYRVRAVNGSTHSENKIHEDSVAKQYGFRGGLVPGVTDYAYMTRPALDAFTRMRMQDEVLRIWQDRGTTMLLVTHDIDEALYMGDRVVIMTPRPGRIERIIDVNLPRPRQRNDEAFLHLRAQILDMLHFGGRVADKHGE